MDPARVLEKARQKWRSLQFLAAQKAISLKGRKTFRLCINDQDFGTTNEAVAKAWLKYRRKHYPAVRTRIEEVADDAPEFLPML